MRDRQYNGRFWPRFRANRWELADSCRFPTRTGRIGGFRTASRQHCYVIPRCHVDSECTFARNVAHPAFGGNRAHLGVVWRNYALRILFGTLPMVSAALVALPNGFHAPNFDEL